MPNGATESAEKIVEKLTRGPDGKALELLQLVGVGVPADAQMYLCKRTFIALQIRTKSSEQSGGILHDYTLNPETISCGKGGVYELESVRSKHHLQVKVQPPLGLAGLLPPYSDTPTSAQLIALLDAELWPCLAVFYILLVFISDPNKSSVPLAPGYADSPKRIEWILQDQKMLDNLCMKVPVFSRTYVQPPKIQLTEPTKPKTRGLLLKAFLEVKLLLIKAVTQIRFNGPDLLDENQYSSFEDFMVHMYEDCCAGGVDAQYLGLEETRDSLRFLVCGGEPPKALPGSEDLPVTNQPVNGTLPHERDQSTPLLRILGDMSRHLESSAVSLTELASMLDAGTPAALLFSTEEKRPHGSRVGAGGSVPELWAQVKRQIDELSVRSQELIDSAAGQSFANGVSNPAKRPKTD